VPDSEVVYGPTLFGFDVGTFVDGQGGYLALYTENVGGESLTGADIVERVAEDYSVGPRTLLALIEMHGGWVRSAEPSERQFPLPDAQPGLYAALTSAADAINRAYYGHRHGGETSILLADGGFVDVPYVNAGTFALLTYLTRDDTLEIWAALDQPGRFYVSWTSLFGDAYQYRVAETLPENLPREELVLPFGAGEIWYYVAGPHSPWGTGAPRAAIDFAPPPPEQTGCHLSGSPVLAVAEGVVTRSRASGVVVDLDGDGFEGSGWTHVYSHLSPVRRMAVGETVKVGDPLGFPSCEGGLPTVSRVAFSRRYNGEWVPADLGRAPLVMSGWRVVAGDEPRQGWLAHPDFDPREAAPAKIPDKNGVAALPGGE
jgi:murein DD-endopeptidase MepM/ murein hydrolase activator NlpD